MTQWNTEVKNSYEIWWYKSVEELASEAARRAVDAAEFVKVVQAKLISDK